MAAGSLPRAVLYVCTQNSVRSPMAEALTRFLFGTSIRVASVGLDAGEPDGFAMAVLGEAGLDLLRHAPRSLEELENFDFDLVVALSPEAHRRSLEFFRNRHVPVEYWPTLDAAVFDGARDQKLDAYRAVRDGLLLRIKQRFDWPSLGGLLAPAVLWCGEVSGGVAGRHEALRAFCAKTLLVAPERVTLAHDALSAPLLLLDGAEAGWRLSSASRENIALFGLSREKIGVDVELLARDGDPVPEIPWNVLDELETAALRAFPESGRAEEFLRLWTAKEAYLKALGLGLRREPTEIRIVARAKTFGVLDRGREIATREARLWREQVGAKLALCASVLLPDGAQG